MKLNRIRKNWEYRKFFGANDVYHLGACSVFRIPNSFEHFRFGITLKARGTSVQRNRTKRVIREAFQQVGQDARKTLGSFDYNVVVPRRRSLNLEYWAGLRKSLESDLLKRLVSEPK